MNQPHIPLHLKYRPQNFNQIIGQFKATRYLELAIKDKKIAFAYLFAGQHGSGKTTLARVMAKALNCTSTGTIPCNICANCINIHLGHSFDFYEIDAAKNTGIENIREIIENIQFAPMMSKYKVCIIDEAHMLSNNAFNSLLKTLESPPAKTVFILSTTAVNKIPDTIVSRCQTIYFQPIKDRDLVIAISQIVNNEKIKITNKAIINLLKITKGSFRDALNIIEIFSIEKQNITEQALNEKYFLPSLYILELLIEKILSLNLLEALIFIDYIQTHNWNEEYIINSMYDLLINKYVNNIQPYSISKYVFFNTKIIMHLLKILIDSKVNNQSDCWSNIILLILENINKKIKLPDYKKKRRVHLYVQKNKIYSN